MTIKVVRVELTSHAHATEDVNKVLKAVLTLVPPSVRGRAKIQKETLEGHYSNPITRITVTLLGNDAIETVKYMLSATDKTSISLLSSSLDLKYDSRSGKLYLRFDKQEAYLGRLRLTDGDDVVRVVIVFQGRPSITDIRKFVEKFSGG